MKSVEEISKLSNLIINENTEAGGSGYLVYGSLKNCSVLWGRKESGKYDHVSICPANRMPSWDDMCKVKDMFFKEDEECYQDGITFYEQDQLDENGSAVSTYNPNSKYDWYTIGGRWQGMLKAKTGLFGEKSFFDLSIYEDGKFDSAKVSDIEFPYDFTTFAVLLPDGKWYEKGKMGWWAIVSDEKEDWGTHYKERFLDTANPDWVLTIVDCHI